MSLIGFIPLPETSHVNATLGLAKALRSRGHRVNYFAPLDFEEFLIRQGFDYTPICEDLLPKGSYQQGDPLLSNEVGVRLYLMICEGKFDDVLRRGQPDLLVVDSYAQHMALIGYKLGIPTLLLSPTAPRARNPWIPPSAESLAPNSFLSKSRARLSWYRYDLHRLYLLMRGVKRQFLEPVAASANYPLSQIDNRGYFPILKLIPELILCPQEFDLPRAGSESLLHYIGAYTDLQREEDISFPWEMIRQDKPLIYCALGSLSHRFEWTRGFLQVVIDAVGLREDWQLVLAAGTHLSASDFCRVAANVIVVDRAPQIALLKRADLMITHGGFNSIKECIMQGVPMIVFHRSITANAVRVAYHGLGLMGEVEKACVRQIQSMIHTILSDRSFRQRTESMRERFIEAERSDLGVKAIELVLAARSAEALFKNRLR